MISEALEMRAKSGRLSHNWCMCVASHGYGGLGGGSDGGGGWHECGTKRVGRMSEMPEHFPSAR